MSALSGI